MKTKRKITYHYYRPYICYEETDTKKPFNIADWIIQFSNSKKNKKTHRIVKHYCICG